MTNAAFARTCRGHPPPRKCFPTIHQVILAGSLLGLGCREPLHAVPPRSSNAAGAYLICTRSLQTALTWAHHMWCCSSGHHHAWRCCYHVSRNTCPGERMRGPWHKGSGRCRWHTGGTRSSRVKTLPMVECLTARAVQRWLRGWVRSSLQSWDESIPSLLCHTHPSMSAQQGTASCRCCSSSAEDPRQARIGTVHEP